MVELERNVILTSSSKFPLNSLHKIIVFTYEVENYGKIAFLDLFLLKRKNNDIKTTVHLKLTHYDMYLHWDSFTSAP